jgi:hypothetical protein
MIFRSSNTSGYTHFGGDVVSNVESSHGVQLTGGSTGGIVQPVGDDTDITLKLLGKGAGGVVIGNSSQAVTIAGGTAFKGFNASTYTVQFAAISSGQTLEVALSTAFGSFAPGDLVQIETVITPSEITFGGFRLAADASTRLTMILNNPGSTAGSTGRVTGRVVWADLT